MDISAIYILKGIVYYGDEHFTARIFINNDVWFHDGITTSQKCIKEGNINYFTNDDLLQCQGKIAVLIVFAHETHN